MTEIKRRIHKFFKNGDDELVFALYEDVDGDINYRCCNYDMDIYKLSDGHFYKEFKQIDGQI